MGGTGILTTEYHAVQCETEVEKQLAPDLSNSAGYDVVTSPTEVRI